MTRLTIAPYGRWASPISADDATAGTRTLSSPRAVDGRGFFLVSQDDGSSTIHEATGDTTRRVLPPPWAVGTSVYEYGGQAYVVLRDDTACAAAASGRSANVLIVFADARDNSCNVLDVGTGVVTPLVPGVPSLRYADFGACRPGDDWLLAVQEDHADPRPAAVRNYVVAIHRRTGRVVRVVAGADFYAHPRMRPAVDAAAAASPSPPAITISWRQWQHPDLPFEGVTLHVATWHPATNTLTAVRQVAGHARQCVGEAAWTPDGRRLVFGMEATGAAARQLFWVDAVDAADAADAPPIHPIALRGLEDVEFAQASWFVGCQTLAFLTPSTLVAAGTRYGRDVLVYVDVDAGTWVSLDAAVGLVAFRFDPLAPLSAASFLVVGSGFATPQAVYRVDLDLDACATALARRRHAVDAAVALATTTRLFRSTDQDMAPRLFSTPELVCVPVPAAASRAASTTADDDGDDDGDDDDDVDDTPAHNVYGWLWPPHNLAFVAPDGTRPPLIVTVHGGPTGYTAPGLSMVAQYWATRGFAYLAVNYSGSSGHGRAYRRRLWGRWGLLDRDDVAACVRFLTAGPGARADAAHVGIEGGSAGGYCVLQSLVGHAALFAAGVCCCGVADTAALMRDTHKLESHYLEWLLWPRHRGPDGSDDDADGPDAPGDAPSPAGQARLHRARSPLFHATRIRAPLRLIHGELDPVVPIAQSRAIAAQIRARGGDVDLVVLPGEGHMFIHKASLVRYLTAEAEWWAKTLVEGPQ